MREPLRPKGWADVALEILRSPRLALIVATYAAVAATACHLGWRPLAHAAHDAVEIRAEAHP